MAPAGSPLLRLPSNIIVVEHVIGAHEVPPIPPVVGDPNDTETIDEESVWFLAQLHELSAKTVK